MKGGDVGGGEVEVVSKTLQLEQKIFYFDLKGNSRGRSLKLSERSSATSSTIIVPEMAIVLFLDIFNYYCSPDDQDVVSKELQLDAKVFHIVIGENKKGRFLKIKLHENGRQIIEHIQAFSTLGKYRFSCCPLCRTSCLCPFFFLKDH